MKDQLCPLKLFRIYFPSNYILYNTLASTGHEVLHLYYYLQLILECSRQSEYNIFLLFTGPRYAIQIGEKMIDYNEEFRLFLSTRNPNPFIPPDAAAVVTEVNFTTTGSGLRGQVSM